MVLKALKSVFIVSTFHAGRSNDLAMASDGTFRNFVVVLEETDDLSRARGGDAMLICVATSCQMLENPIHELTGDFCDA